ncbi:MAG: hypothetical protein H6707_08095 [Deltaproteobacteria bacterium]|nr:hypothetical protein [Deltaproteobacteria bacterium]
MVKTLRALFFSLIALLFLPSPSLQAAPSPADVDLARRHYELGRTYYQQAAYAKALAAFREAYALSKRAALLYNIGKCQEALGQLSEAIASFEAYLAASSQPDPTTRARIRNLQARLPAKSPKPTVVPIVKAQPKPPKIDKPKPQPAIVKRAHPPLAPIASEPKESSKEPSASRWIDWTAWGLVAGGGTLVATSFVLGGLAKSRSDQVNDLYKEGTHNWSDVSSKASQGRGFQTGQIVTAIVGGLAVAGGVTLLLLKPKKAASSEQASFSATMMITPGGLSVDGAF